MTEDKCGGYSNMVMLFSPSFASYCWESIQSRIHATVSRKVIGFGSAHTHRGGLCFVRANGKVKKKTPGMSERHSLLSEGLGTVWKGDHHLETSTEKKNHREVLWCLLLPRIHWWLMLITSHNPFMSSHLLALNALPWHPSLMSHVKPNQQDGKSVG